MGKPVRLVVHGLPAHEAARAGLVSALIRWGGERRLAIRVDSPSVPEWPAATQRLAREVCGPFDPARALRGGS